MSGGLNDACWGVGEDGPAPGDCGGRDLTLAEAEAVGDAGSGGCGEALAAREGPGWDIEAASAGGLKDPVGAADAGRGTGLLLKSSRGGTYDGRGAPFAFAGGMYFLFALLTSGLRASSSRRSWRSYKMDERVCSTSAAVTSSVTSFLCRSRARCKFCEMPSARFAKIISYLLAYEKVVSEAAN